MLCKQTRRAFYTPRRKHLLEKELLLIGRCVKKTDNSEDLPITAVPEHVTAMATTDFVLLSYVPWQ